LQTTPAAQRNFAAFPPAEAPRESQILPLAPADAAWNYRLSQQHYALHGVIPPRVPWGLSDASITRLWDRETRIRCTCAALAAIAYRRTHGAFPSTLADVSPEFCTPELVTDPWTGNLLQIRPQGLPADLRDQASSSLAVPARTPFVWSSGPDLTTLLRMGEGEKWLIYVSQTFGGIYIRPTRYLFTLPVKGFPDALLPENGAPGN
jgi:hypothetical protein